jgi:choice-of-anchor C domain-containing protein
MKKTVLTGLATGLFMVLTVEIASANLITNGSFETGTNAPTGSFRTLLAGNTDIGGWTVDSGSIDWINTCWTASDGQRSIDMAGNSVGMLRSDAFATEIGATYQVTFDMAANFAGLSQTTLEMAVGVDYGTGAYTQYVQYTRNGQTATGMQWQQMSRQFEASTSSLSIFFSPPDYDEWIDNWSAYGPAIDNVIVTKVGGSPVPEPTTLLLFGTGFACLAGVVRRKKKD